MRTLVQPPPSSRCERCGGELRFKAIETANHPADLDIECFVCASCGGEKSFGVNRDHYRPRSMVA